MPADIRVKICGLTDPVTLAAACDAGAAYVGLNFFPRSPRYVTPAAAADLAVTVPPGVAKVALVVDADNDLLDAIIGTVPVDMIQLHGHETPARVREVQGRYGLPVMKVIGIADRSDLIALQDHWQVADQILVDAKAPKDAVLPGGNGLTFDWSLLAERRWPCPWMLAGGLTAANVGEAIRLTHARQVDVSSGVESAPGVKDADMIRAFIAAAQS